LRSNTTKRTYRIFKNISTSQPFRLQRRESGYIKSEGAIMEQYLQQLDKINQYLDFERQKGEKQRHTETLRQFVTMKGE